MRVLRHRENAIILLSNKANSVMFKPLVGIAIVEGFEEPLKQSVATRIYLRKVRYPFKRVGAVASAATRYLHFGQHLLRSLKDGNVHLRAHLLKVHRQKESCRSSANYCCLQIHFSIRMRASTATTSFSSANSGLMSISLISVAKRSMVESLTMISANFCSLMPFCPRVPFNIL